MIGTFFTVLPWAASILLFAACWAGLWWIRRETLKRGAVDEQNRQQGKALDDVQKVNAGRDRLRADPDYARKLRDKYTRDD